MAFSNRIYAQLSLKSAWLTPAARFSKVAITFRARKAIL